MRSLRDIRSTFWRRSLVVLLHPLAAVGCLVAAAGVGIGAFWTAFSGVVAECLPRIWRGAVACWRGKDSH